MSASTREQLLLETLAVAADTLVEDFDVIDFLQDLVDRCAAIFDAVDVGIVLADSDGDLAVVASTSERLRLIEVLQLRAGGPCVDSFDTGEVVTAGSPEDMEERWPQFSAEAGRSGYRSVHAVPLRLRRTTIGSLNFFSDQAGELSTADAGVAQTIADVATIGLMQERAAREATLAQEQLRRALAARVLVEQAKGVLADSHSIDMDAAWQVLRREARVRRSRVTDLARGVVDGRIAL
jgi:GAF domain-containing protein